MENRVRISKRERQVLKMLLDECLNHEVADVLGLNEKTISTYKLRLLKKTKCKTIVGLYRWNELYKLVEVEHRDIVKCTVVQSKRKD